MTCQCIQDLLKEFKIGFVAFGAGNAQELTGYFMLIFALLLIAYLALFVDAQQNVALPKPAEETAAPANEKSTPVKAASPVKASAAAQHSSPERAMKIDKTDNVLHATSESSTEEDLPAKTPSKKSKKAASAIKVEDSGSFMSPDGRRSMRNRRPAAEH